jgi:NADH-quinone oxidoreductase subunit C
LNDQAGAIETAAVGLERAEELLGGIATGFRVVDQRLMIELEPADLVKAATILRDDPLLSCSYLSFLSGVDNIDDFEVIYLLRSLNHPVIVQLTVKLPRKEPSVPTVTGVWTGANWHEREAYDLFGIRFDKHPDLRRILNREDLDVFPGRKDARPHRKERPEWGWKGLEPARRLPGERDRRERS